MSKHKKVRGGVRGCDDSEMYDALLYSPPPNKKDHVKPSGCLNPADLILTKGEQLEDRVRREGPTDSALFGHYERTRTGRHNAAEHHNAMKKKTRN